MVMMPIDFPPPEIIEALEEQLGMDFIHYTVSIEGTVEGVFGDGIDSQVVSFEDKREIVNGYTFPPFESIIAELDEKAIEDMKKMFKSILQEIEDMGDTPNPIEYGETPRFDNEWYCP